MEDEMTLEEKAFLLDLQNVTDVQPVLGGLQMAYQKIPLEDITMIGRDAFAEIIIGKDTVSPSHAVIRREAGEYLITDLGSSHGTYVKRNDEDKGDITVKLEPRKPFALRHRDKVILGGLKNGYSFKFRMHDTKSDLPVLDEYLVLLPSSGVSEPGKIGSRRVLGSGKQYPLHEGVFIGDDGLSEVKTSVPGYSGQFAKIEKRERGYFVTLLKKGLQARIWNSETGSLEHLQHMKMHQLEPMDFILLGGHRGLAFYRFGIVEVEE